MTNTERALRWGALPFVIGFGLFVGSCSGLIFSSAIGGSEDYPLGSAWWIDIVVGACGTLVAVSVALDTTKTESRAGQYFIAIIALAGAGALSRLMRSDVRFVLTGGAMGLLWLWWQAKKEASGK